MAEPLVFLPPMLCDARVFAPQVAELSRERAVTVAPVHGAERIEEIASGLLDVLPSKFALAGMGFGGVVALELLRRADKRVTRLALMDTTPLPETPQEASAREARIVSAKMGRMAEVVAQEVPSSALFDGPDRPGIMGLMRNMAQSLGGPAYVQQSRAMQKRKDQQSNLRKVGRPILVLCGAHDTLIPLKRHEFLAELVTGATLSVIENAGHMPTLENPAATTEALRNWLEAPLNAR